MQTAGTMASFTPDARLRPGAHNARLPILIAGGVITCGMTGATIVFLFLLTGVIVHPASSLVDERVGEIVLIKISGIADLRSGLVGDDVTILVYKAGLPGITTNHITDIVPGVALRWLTKLVERVLRRLAIYHWI